jgi:hypothetical protein
MKVKCGARFRFVTLMDETLDSWIVGSPHVPTWLHPLSAHSIELCRIGWSCFKWLGSVVLESWRDRPTGYGQRPTGDGWRQWGGGEKSTRRCFKVAAALRWMVATDGSSWSLRREGERAEVLANWRRIAREDEAHRGPNLLRWTELQWPDSDRRSPERWWQLPRARFEREVVRRRNSPRGGGSGLL